MTRNQATKCSAPDCTAKVRRLSPSGMCAYHYTEARAAKVKRCDDCGRALQKGGKPRTVCQSCKTIRNARTCTECGNKFSATRFRKTGKCDPCQSRVPTIREQIGEDNLADFYYLKKRGMKRDEAIAFIKSGQPVIRKFNTPNAKITTMQAVQMVGDALAISPREILSDSRFSLAVDCRAVVVAVMHRQGVSDCAIGRRMNRDHTSILYLRQTFDKRTAKRPVLGRLVERILEAA